MKLLPQLEYRPPDGSDPSFVTVDLDHPDSWPLDGNEFALALTGLAAFSVTDVEHASGQLYDGLVQAIPQFTPAQPGDSLLAVFMTCCMHNLDAGLPAREAEQRAQAQYVNLLRHAVEVFDFPDEDGEAALESGIRLQMERLADPRLLKPPELEHLSRHMLLRAAALAASGRSRRSQDPVPDERTPEPAVPEPSSASDSLPSGEEPAKPKKKMGLGRLLNIVLIVAALAVPLFQKLTEQPAAPRRPAARQEQARPPRAAPAKLPPGSSVEPRIAWTGDVSVTLEGIGLAVPALDGFSEAWIKDGQFLATSGSTGPDRRYLSMSPDVSGSPFTEYCEQLRSISQKTNNSIIMDRKEGVVVLLPVSMAHGASELFGEEIPGDLIIAAMALSAGRQSLHISIFAEDTPENRSWMEETLPEWCGAVIQANAEIRQESEPVQ